MSASRVWLRHGHGGYFECPVDAVNEFADLGWAPSDAPPEFNPATAEMPTFQPPAPVAGEQPPAIKPGKKSGASSEGSD